MKQQTCYKIRGLMSVPQVTVEKVQERNARREKQKGQELLILQCVQCKMVLHRAYLQSPRLHTEHGQSPSQPLSELQRVRVKVTEGGASLHCGKCQSKVATLEGPAMTATLHSLLMIIPEGPDPQLQLQRVPREPFCTLGAFTGLSYRNLMAELYRLAYTKQLRYRLTFRDLLEKLRGYEARFKGLSNLIMLNETAREGPAQTGIREDDALDNCGAQQQSSLQQSSASHSQQTQRKKPRSAQIVINQSHSIFKQSNARRRAAIATCAAREDHLLPDVWSVRQHRPAEAKAADVPQGDGAGRPQAVPLQQGKRRQTQLLDDKSNVHDQGIASNALIYFKLKKGNTGEWEDIPEIGL